MTICKLESVICGNWWASWRPAFTAFTSCGGRPRLALIACGGALRQNLSVLVRRTSEVSSVFTLQMRKYSSVRPWNPTGVPRATCRMRRASLDRGRHLFDLFGRNANGAVQRNAGTPEQGGEQVALISPDIGEESARVD